MNQNESEDVLNDSQENLSSLLHENIEYTTTTPQFETAKEMQSGDDALILQSNEDQSSIWKEPIQAIEQNEKPKVTPLNKGGVLTVCVIFVCEGFQYSFLFPFIGFMVCLFFIFCCGADNM